MKIRFPSFKILILFFMGFISCKKEKNAPPPLPPILTLNFTEKFIPDQLPVIVFISDLKGKVITDTTCSSNGIYVLYPPDGKSIPDNFMVTVVNSEIYWHNLMVHINTYTNVAKGSEWTIKGTKPDTVGMATISLVNLPTHSGPILYSNSGYSNTTFDPLDRIALLYTSPDDLYVKIQTSGGQLFKIVKNIVRNGNYSINMSDVNQATSHTISFPISAENYEAELYGYKNANYDSPIPILADNLISDGLPVNSVNLYYPPSVFSGFHTKLMLQETYSSDAAFYYHTEGSIPDEFQKINADILSMQPKKGSLAIQTSGTYNMTGAHWEFVDHALVFYEWQLFAPDTTRTMIIPEIAPALKRMFPSISLDSLNFQYAELTDFQNLASYDDLINKLFDPAHPSQMDRFDATTLRKILISH
jgi:hypothetical protein